MPSIHANHPGMSSQGGLPIGPPGGAPPIFSGMNPDGSVSTYARPPKFPPQSAPESAPEEFLRPHVVCPSDKRIPQRTSSGRATQCCDKNGNCCSLGEPHIGLPPCFRDEYERFSGGSRLFKMTDILTIALIVLVIFYFFRR